MADSTGPGGSPESKPERNRETGAEGLLLPVGSILVHIGPYKTGTTAIQMSMHQHREEMRSHGVLYPGTETRLRRPGRALVGYSPRGLKRVPLREWEAIVDEVQASGADRVCLSTETFAGAGVGPIARLIDDFGAERIHMVAAVRRLDKLLPSNWQQRIHDHGETRGYEDFLRRHLVDPDRRAEAPVVDRFWKAQDPAQLLARWGEFLPREQITLVVTDEGDRGQLHRTFEALLGLPAGLLSQAERDNASFSAERAEFQRQVNEMFEERGWPEDDRVRLIRRGLTRGLDRAEREDGERRIPPMPDWARARVAEFTEDRIATVRDSGTRVVGDPEWLRVPTDDGEPAEVVPVPDAMPIAPAVSAVEGLIDAVMTQRAQREAQRRPEEAAAERLLAGLTSRQLIREVTRRQYARLVRRRGPS